MKKTTPDENDYNLDNITEDTAETVQTNKLTTFDAINSLSPYVISLIRKKGDTLLQATDLSKEIWMDLRRTDLTLKGIINYITFESIYEKYKNNLIQILGEVTCKDLFELLDSDNDGFLNEDEQILLFSIIKAKMLKVSKEL